MSGLMIQHPPHHVHWPVILDIYTNLKSSLVLGLSPSLSGLSDLIGFG